MLPNIHILGIQGSGKGTQSAFLVERYGLNYLASGNLFRQRAQQKDAFANEISHELQAGHLLPNTYLYRTVREYLAKHKIKKGLLGDGVIRTTEQYHSLEPVWKQHHIGEPVLIHLVLTEEEALKRIAYRKQEQADAQARSHHLVYSGKLLNRTDDNPMAISERFALFHKMTEPVINIFEAEDRCIHIDAGPSPEIILESIVVALEKRYPQLQALHHGTD
jgi:adenylate kinase